MLTRKLTNAIITYLRDGEYLSADNVGDHEVPSDNPPMPYCVVHMQVSGKGEGSLADPEEDRDFVFFILNVGRSREQAQWMSDNVKRRMFAGGLIFIDEEGMNVQGISLDSIGGIVSAGDVLFQGTDTYRVKAGK